MKIQDLQNALNMGANYMANVKVEIQQADGTSYEVEIEDVVESKITNTIKIIAKE